MITGDHPGTAARIAADLGIIADDGASRSPVPSSTRSTTPTLAATVRTSSVYARVAPEHKLRIVDALQADGNDRRHDRRRRQRRARR